MGVPPRASTEDNIKISRAKAGKGEAAADRE